MLSMRARKHVSTQARQARDLADSLTTPYFNIPVLVDVEILKIHLLLKNLFNIKVQHAPLTGRLKFPLRNWEKLTQDGNILSIVQGSKISFCRTPFQHTLPQTTRVNQEERLLINSEIHEMLRKGAIQQVQPEPGQFLSNLFLVDKKDGGHRPVKNLKDLNASIHY